MEIIVLGVVLLVLLVVCIYIDMSKPTIKGNINNKGEKIYHIPGDKYYDITKIDPSRGEKMFFTETDAMTEGFRRTDIR